MSFFFYIDKTYIYIQGNIHMGKTNKKGKFQRKTNKKGSHF